MANIMLVDDEVEILELIEAYLMGDHTVFKYDNPLDALAALNEGQDNDVSASGGSLVDLAILDIMMPGMDGFALCRKIRERHTFPIIMLTAKDGDYDKIGGLTLGADDYMVKPFNPLELLARVNAQLRRARILYETDNTKDNLVLEIRGLRVDSQAHTCSLYGKEVILTPTEFSILLLLCKNKGRVISSERIFEAVWGEDYYDGNNTVMVHIQKLRKKLGDTKKRKDYIQTVWGVGYKIEE
ncbi:MAG: response regulator transcription factor [Oscillospiraceae bacterium]|nr:response regulator transcription factor [Oscillospiraceae bacterium]